MIIHSPVPWQENGIPALRLKGSSKDSRMLKEFKTDQSVAALLLPMKMGSGGLNLTEATHVLLIEPSLNPGMERQAVGRVHRIGQTRETCVHRFVITESVEETISTIVATADDDARVAHEERHSPKKRRVKYDAGGDMTISTFKNLFALQRGRVPSGPGTAAAAAVPRSSSTASRVVVVDGQDIDASAGSSVSENGGQSPGKGSATAASAAASTAAADPRDTLFWDGMVSLQGLGFCDRDKAARTITMRKSAVGLGPGSDATSALIRDEPLIFLFGECLAFPTVPACVLACFRCMGCAERTGLQDAILVKGRVDCSLTLLSGHISQGEWCISVWRWISFVSPRRLMFGMKACWLPSASVGTSSSLRVLTDGRHAHHLPEKCASGAQLCVLPRCHAWEVAVCCLSQVQSRAPLYNHTVQLYCKIVTARQCSSAVRYATVHECGEARMHRKFCALQSATLLGAGS
jgi:hypothetical protein